jgi:hypothetical protein
MSPSRVPRPPRPRGVEPLHALISARLAPLALAPAEAVVVVVARMRLPGFEIRFPVPPHVGLRGCHSPLVASLSRVL